MMTLQRTLWLCWTSIALQAVFVVMIFNADQMPIDSGKIYFAAYWNFIAFIFLWIRRYDLAGRLTWF